MYLVPVRKLSGSPHNPASRVVYTTRLLDRYLSSAVAVMLMVETKRLVPWNIVKI